MSAHEHEAFSDPDVNRYLAAVVPPICRVCRVLQDCGGVLDDCPYRDPESREDQ